MKSLAMKGLSVALAAAVTIGFAWSQSLPDRPALDFTGSASSVSADQDTAFARSVAARYGENSTVAEVLADARAQGFQCVSASSCTRSTMDGPCAEAWIIDIAPDQSVSGRHVRRCMGGEED